MESLERNVRAAVYESFRQKTKTSTPEGLADKTGATRTEVVSALHALADEHCLKCWVPEIYPAYSK